MPVLEAGSLQWRGALVPHAPAPAPAPCPPSRARALDKFRPQTELVSVQPPPLGETRANPSSLPGGLGLRVDSGKLSRPGDGHTMDGLPLSKRTKESRSECRRGQSGQVRRREKTFPGPSPHPHATGARLPEELAFPSPAETSTARDGQNKNKHFPFPGRGATPTRRAAASRGRPALSSPPPLIVSPDPRPAHGQEQWPRRCPGQRRPAPTFQIW
ncbi:uncharacterized protein [Castor canadensis]|uniref:Uncharacterized protein n=1 Tax=Castor canadensis TaxID=51338 RepID=A0AC58MZY6_CASCN